MEHLPIIIVHQGNQNYLRTCIEQARKSSPKNQIHLIGDSSNRDFGARHHDIHSSDDSLHRDIPLFQSLYRHSSNQGLIFERFCIERWFLIRNLMDAMAINQCCAIDSDVLLFRPIDEAREALSGYAMSFGRWDRTKLLPHFNIIQDKLALDSFCDFVLDIFSNPKKLDDHARAIKNAKGRSWICDMSLFWAWSQSQKDAKIAVFEDLGETTADFDSSISNVRHFKPSPYHFLITRRWKKITFHNGQALAIRHNQTVSMRFIHYHGKFKVLMKRHSQGQPDSPRCFQLLMAEKARALPSKLRLFYKNYLKRPG